MFGPRQAVTDWAQVKILRRGADVWNRWRAQNRVEANLQGVDLTGADLAKVDLSGADLSRADLVKANLFGADLKGANLAEANLTMVNLGQAVLTRAYFAKANLFGADLKMANLAEANLTMANLRLVDFSVANLSGVSAYGANLSRANLSLANLSEANLAGSLMSFTTLGDIDLSTVKGLDQVRHEGPSTIGIDTIYRSHGKIPETFLRGAGIPENFIEYMTALAAQPLAFEYYSCFISHSSQDQDFVNRLHADLRAEKVRCWFAPEHLKIGDKFRWEIDHAIQRHEKLLLVLSKNSIKSHWVEKEVETAFEIERRQKRSVLFPIRLDDTVMNAEEAWAADIRRTRHIGNFTAWKNHKHYTAALTRLLRDLRTTEEGHVDLEIPRALAQKHM